MSIYYVDPVSGDDATGDGSAGNPWKHITKANENVISGDEVRVKATTAHTDLSGTGTATPTNGSHQIPTSASFTGVLSAGDYITFDSSADGGGNGDAEPVFRVYSITASQITLFHNYHGASSGTPSTVYKVNPATQTYETTYGARATVEGVEYSGGWTDITGTPTRNSYTFLKNQVGGSTTNRYACLIQNSPEVHHLNFLEYYYGVYFPANNPEIYNITANAYRWAFYNVSSEPIMYDCVGIGDLYTSDGAGYRHASGGEEFTITDCIFYAYKYTVNDSYQDTLITFENCKFYGSRVNGSGGVNTSRKLYKDCEFDSSYTDYYAQYGGNVFQGCTFSNATYASVFGTSDVDGSYFYDCTFENASGTYGAIYNYRNAMFIDNCEFNNCNYGVRSDVLSKATVIRGCSFNTPTAYAIYVHGRGTPVQIEGCSIDAPSSAKAITVTAGGYVIPAYSLKNSFGLPDGSYYDSGSITQDTTTTYGGNPTIKINYSSTNADLVWKPLFRTFVNSGVETTFSWYHKFDSAWATDIELRFVLNGIVIETEVDITSFPTTFTNITRTCSSGAITEDGILALEYRAKVKPQAKSFWVGGFSVT